MAVSVLASRLNLGFSDFIYAGIADRFLVCLLYRDGALGGRHLVRPG